nr:pinopsin-like [Lytechinus pictus]
MNHSTPNMNSTPSFPGSSPWTSTLKSTSMSNFMTDVLTTVNAFSGIGNATPPSTFGPSSLVVPVSRSTYNYLTVYTGFLTIFGILNNGLVMVLFARYPSLRHPINSFLFNVSLSDLIISCLASPFTFASNFAGRWLFGDLGCTLYAFLVFVAGTEQIVILAALSIQRCMLVVRPFTAQKMTHNWAVFFIALTWIYSLIICLPPLFGWNSYTYEGPGTACSIAWNSNLPGDSSYIIFIFVMVLVIPFTIIIFSYGLLVYAVKKISQTQAAMSSEAKADRKVTKMIFIMITFFLITWAPYSGFSLYVAFGKNVVITPLAGTFPPFFAKLCTIHNPIIYFLLNKQFKDALIQFLCCGENPFDRDESDQGERRHRPLGGRTGASGTNPQGGRGRASSLPTATSMLDIPQAASTSALQNKHNLEQGGASTTKDDRVFEISSKIQKFEISEKMNASCSQDASGAPSSSGVMKPTRRAMKNQVGYLPPVDN